MALDQTSFAWALKSLWDKRRVEEMAYKDHPFLALIPKDEGFKGKNKVIGLKHALTPGRSAAIATAITNKGNHTGKAFTITRAKDYAVASIDAETIESSEGDAASLAEASDTEIESAMEAATRSLSASLFGDGAGNIGRVSSVSSGVITLTNANDVVFFEIGQKIVANPTRTGTSGNMRSGTGTVSAVDRDAGTVTYTGTITSIAANDYLYTEGDYDAKLKGLLAWIPTSAPSSTSFFGVDRSVDVTRLGGIRYDASNLNIEEGLQKAAVRSAREGARLSHFLMNHADWVNLSLSAQTKATVEMVKVPGYDFGFEALNVRGPKGMIKCIADSDCPSGYSWGVTMSSLKLETLKSAPRILGLDGNKMLREATADAYEIRVGYYGQMSCNAPGHNVVVTLPS